MYYIYHKFQLLHVVVLLYQKYYTNVWLTINIKSTELSEIKSINLVFIQMQYHSPLAAETTLSLGVGVTDAFPLGGQVIFLLCVQSVPPARCLSGVNCCTLLGCPSAGKRDVGFCWRWRHWCWISPSERWCRFARLSREAARGMREREVGGMHGHVAVHRIRCLTLDSQIWLTLIGLLGWI